MSLCPCGSAKPLSECCGPYLAGKAQAPTAEALMRSRYTAYATGNIDYVERTDASSARESFNRLDAEQIVAETTWQGLEIIRTEQGGEKDDTGLVEFVFRYTQRNQPCVQHELSTFVRENGLWLYENSEINPKQPPVHTEKIGRNDPCTCGSGRKFKKCCGA